MLQNNASLLGWIAAAVVAAIFFISRKRNGANGKEPAGVKEPLNPQVIYIEREPDKVVGDPVGSFGGANESVSTTSEPTSPNVPQSEREPTGQNEELQLQAISPGIAEPVGDPGGFLGATTEPISNGVEPVTPDSEIDMSLSNSQLAQKIQDHVISGDGSYREDLDANQDGKLNIFDAAYAFRGQHR